MTANSNVKQFADELSDVLMRIEDAKVEAAAIIDAAKQAGVDVKALRKVAKELVMQPDKLASRYAAEEQLDLFRAQVGIFKRKGLDTTDKASDAARKSMRQRADKSLRELDGMLGTNMADDNESIRKRVNAYTAGKAVE